MIYLTDLPSLSSLNLEMHSGDTETLVEAVVLAERVGLGVKLRFFRVLRRMWEVRRVAMGEAYPDLLYKTVSTCFWVAGGVGTGRASLP